MAGFHFRHKLTCDSQEILSAHGIDVCLVIHHLKEPGIGVRAQRILNAAEIGFLANANGVAVRMVYDFMMFKDIFSSLTPG